LQENPLTMSMINKLYLDYLELIKFLRKHQEISFENTVRGNFEKVFIIAVASFFEKEIKNLIIKYTENNTNRNELLVNFIRNKAVSRQYHSFFDWTANNANSFFGLFGPGFKSFMKEKVNNDQKLQDSIRAFLGLGDLRNKLVHNDYASFTLDKTVEEIFNDFKLAEYFLHSLDEAFANYIKEDTQQAGAADG